MTSAGNDNSAKNAGNGPSLRTLQRKIAACDLCADDLDHDPRPVVRPSSTARIMIAGQAPGTRVHESGVPFTDPSGDRLRDWMGVDETVFYDQSRIAIVPMGFCFPGLDAKGGDKPPLKRCAQTWRADLMAAMPQVELILLVGKYAQDWHLGAKKQRTLTATVAAWHDYGPLYMPLPHPSWRNNVWLKKNPWFGGEVLPELKARISALL